MLDKIKRFPTIDHIEEIIGDKTCAIFLGEIENWYDSFDTVKQAEIIERNETFLEHLFEVANDPNIVLRKQKILFWTHNNILIRPLWNPQ